MDDTGIANCTIERNFSEDTARIIDAEARVLVEEGQWRAREILSACRAALDALAAALEEREVMDREQVESLLRAQADKSSAAPAAARLSPAPSLTAK